MEITSEQNSFFSSEPHWTTGTNQGTVYQTQVVSETDEHASQPLKPERSDPGSRAIGTNFTEIPKRDTEIVDCEPCPAKNVSEGCQAGITAQQEKLHIQTSVSDNALGVDYSDTVSGLTRFVNGDSVVRTPGGRSGVVEPAEANKEREVSSECFKLAHQLELHTPEASQPFDNFHSFQTLQSVQAQLNLPPEILFSVQGPQHMGTVGLQNALQNSHDIDVSLGLHSQIPPQQHLELHLGFHQALAGHNQAQNAPPECTLVRSQPEVAQQLEPPQTLTPLPSQPQGIAQELNHTEAAPSSQVPTQPGAAASPAEPSHQNQQQGADTTLLGQKRRGAIPGRKHKPGLKREAANLAAKAAIAAKFKETNPRPKHKDLIDFAQREFNVRVSQPVVSKITKEADYWIEQGRLAQLSGKVDVKRQRSKKLPQLEQALYGWYLQVDAMSGGRPLPDQVLLMKAQELAAEMGLDTQNKGSCNLTQAWLDKWKNRCNVLPRLGFSQPAAPDQSRGDLPATRGSPQPPAEMAPAAAQQGAEPRPMGAAAAPVVMNGAPLDPPSPPQPPFSHPPPGPQTASGQSPALSSPFPS